MAVSDKINNLKQGPKEDKVAVASGIAVSVVVVLLVAWAIFFFRNIQRGSQQLDLGGGAQDQFNFSNVRDAQLRLRQEYGTGAKNDELLEVRDAAASGQTGTQLRNSSQQIQGRTPDQFGTSQ
ncbi:MAG: hypothetical protein RLZZ416_645 [Candidatus Parcubacteria bacterium]|jgi:hypothetical protein